MENNPYQLGNPPVTAGLEEQKPPKVYTAHDFIASLICLVFGYMNLDLIIKVFRFRSTGLASSVFYLMVTGVLIFYRLKSGKKFNRHSVTALAFAVILSLNLFIASSNTVKNIDCIFITLMIIYASYASENGLNKIRNTFSRDFIKSVFVPFNFFGDIFGSLKYGVKDKSKLKNVKYALGGLIIAFPVTFIVSFLLFSSDDNFGNLFSRIFGDMDFNFMQYVVKIIVSIPISCYIFGMVYEKNSPESDLSEIENSFRIVPPVMACFSVVPVCVLYVMYLALQSTYFFSAFGNRLPQGFSYSEYARKGFFELTVVSVINLGIIIALQSFTKLNAENRKPKSLKIFTGLISCFTLLLITTALSKMFMYIKQYGLTILRVYTSLFMILLTVVFISIIISQFRENFNTMKVAVISFCAYLAIFSFVPMDNIIAGYNVKNYLNGNLEEIDTYMIYYDLAPSASAELIPLLDAEDTDTERIDKWLESVADDIKYQSFIYKANISDRIALSKIRNALKD